MIKFEAFYLIIIDIFIDYSHLQESCTFKTEHEYLELSIVQIICYAPEGKNNIKLFPVHVSAIVIDTYIYRS